MFRCDDGKQTAEHCLSIVDVPDFAICFLLVDQNWLVRKRLFHLCHSNSMRLNLPKVAFVPFKRG